jgi:hypothetical protein
MSRKSTPPEVPEAQTQALTSTPDPAAKREPVARPAAQGKQGKQARAAPP